jgi:phage-related protein (TIGR01555 family)
VATAYKKRPRSKPTLAERGLGVQGKGTSFAQDFFSNVAARTGFGTSSLENGTDYNITRWTLNWWSVLSLFETSWVARRVIVGVAEDIMKTWPRVLTEADPKNLVKLDAAIRSTNTKNRILEALTLGRLYGGAGALIVIKGHEKILDEPIDFDKIELGSYKGVIPFDRWTGIMPGTEICTDLNHPLDFGHPEFYECTTRDGKSFKVHCSRIIRFTGPMMPEPERSAYSGWGISTLAPIVQTIMSFDNVSYNALSLTFRAQIIGMKVPDLAAMTSGLGSPQGANQKFLQRMAAVNEMLSNQNLVLLPADGELSKIDYSFSGLSELIQVYQLAVAGSAEMPVSKLWGRTYNGLGQAGEGDEKEYAQSIATKADVQLRPGLEKLYPVIEASELGEVLTDSDLYFPSIRSLDEKEKAELAKTTADTLTVYLNSGVMSARLVAQEVKQSSEATGLGSSITDDFIAKLSDKVQAEGELGEGLFGEGGEGLNPASSPSKAIKETDKHVKAEEEQPQQEGDIKPVETEDSRAARKQRRADKYAAIVDLAKGVREKLRAQAEDEAFEEGEHPRDDAGKFASGSGGHGASLKGRTDVKRGTQAVTKSGRPATVVSVEGTNAWVQYKENGSKSRVPLSALFEPATGKQTSKQTLAGSLAAEGFYNSAAATQYKNDPDKAALEERAVPEKRAKENFMPMAEGECHWNAAKALQAGDIDSIHIGYAKHPSSGWFQHTWGSKNGHTVELNPENEDVSSYMGTPLDGAETQRLLNLTAAHPPGAGYLRTKKGGAILSSGRGKAADADRSAIMSLTVHGIPVVIEHRKGQRRSKWLMAYDYGYIEGVRGADGDSMDVALGPAPEADWVYVFDQRNLAPMRGFDEHKCFLGWPDMDSAVRAFNAGHDHACQVYMDVTPMQMEEFKDWLRKGDHTRPMGGVKK